MRRFSSSKHAGREAPESRRAVVAYALAWLVAAGLAVGIVFAVFGRDDEVSLPPVQSTELEQAAGHGRCQLRSARSGEQFNPPVDGAPAARPAAAGVYDKPVATASLVAAQRRGVVVIQFRADLGDPVKQQLQRLQAAVPRGTIVVPNATGMPFQVAVTAYRRLLGCTHFTTKGLDAVRLFRGRFLGSGPDPTSK